MQPHDPGAFTYSGKLAVMLAASRDCSLMRTDLAVLGVVLEHADTTTGEAWPSVARIVDRSGVPRSTALRAIARLERAGHLRVERRTGSSSVYWLTSPTGGTGVTGGTGSISGTGTGATGETGVVSPVGPKESSKKQEVKKKAHSPALDFSSWPQEPSAEVLQDWLRLRKSKRAPTTPTAMKGIGRELHKLAQAGIGVDAALGECVMRGWQGLKADWLLDSGRRSSAVTQLRAGTVQRDTRSEDEINAENEAELRRFGMGGARG